MLNRFIARAAALAVAMAWGVPAAQAQITVNLHPGDFTYQFADPTTGAPITSLVIPTVGGTARVAVYLIQNPDASSTPQNLIQQLGAEGLGVRLNYASPAGKVMVPDTFNSSITPPPPPSFNPNNNTSTYTLVKRYGSSNGADTTLSAALEDGLSTNNDPLPFPGTEDPLGNKLRMLIGTFTIKGVAATAPGSPEVLTAVDPFAGTDNLSGPNPTITGLRSDGTTGPLPGNGAQGEISIDQFLSTTAPTLLVTVGVPEPSTLALGGLAVAGLAAWRRRRTPAASIAA
jgi:hypothetical protein